ncbi:hypothetical protein [Bacillus cereus]|uniref:hypothetical protein n=1 Tax=Bacillus cereus TaxID=1396 RepID=UPI000BEC4006|nr:hypothetical protein [Bacillus cereus]PDY64171.1 hypothetical protein COM88_17170 [Bacillus cereus]PGQ90344.1 hypothetical protein COA26_04010 [Bacillus cereus]
MFLSQLSFYQLEIKNTCPKEAITSSTTESFYAYGSAWLKACNTISNFLQQNNYIKDDLNIVFNEDPKNEVYRYTWSGIHKSTFKKLEVTIIYTQFADTEDFYRECTCCNKVMFEGYCIHEGLEYFCSDKCLHTQYTPDEYEEMHEDDYAYWTVWLE